MPYQGRQLPELVVVLAGLRTRLPTFVEAKHGGRYIIIDLPNSLKFAYCWLRMNQRNVRFILSVDDVALASSETEIDDAPTFWLVPSDNTPLLTRFIDLAINTLSFTEMTRDIVSQYATFLRHGLAPHALNRIMNTRNIKGLIICALHMKS